jgi:hypothetical protein
LAGFKIARTKDAIHIFMIAEKNQIPGIKLEFEIQFPTLFLQRLATFGRLNKNFSTCLKKENIAAPHGLCFLSLQQH